MLNHMADHMAQEGHPPADRVTMNQRLETVRNEMLASCPDFQFIQDIADVTKHAKLSIPKNLSKPLREVQTSDRVVATLGLFDAPFGEGVFLDGIEVYVTLQNGATKPLLPAIFSVLHAWRSRL